MEGSIFDIVAECKNPAVAATRLTARFQPWLAIIVVRDLLFLKNDLFWICSSDVADFIDGNRVIP